MEFKITNMCIHLYMVSWFEKSKEVILSQGQSKDEAVTNMIEDLFDLLMVKVTLIVKDHEFIRRLFVLV